MALGASTRSSGPSGMDKPTLILITKLMFYPPSLPLLVLVVAVIRAGMLVMGTP